MQEQLPTEASGRTGFGPGFVTLGKERLSPTAGLSPATSSSMWSWPFHVECGCCIAVSPGSPLPAGPGLSSWAGGLRVASSLVALLHLGAACRSPGRAAQPRAAMAADP